MYGKVASSGGWIALTESEYTKTFTLESPVTYLKIMWSSDSVTNGNISIYLNDDSSPVVPDLLVGNSTSIGNTGFEFEIKDLPVYKFSVQFSESNPNRSVNYYGYY